MGPGLARKSLDLLGETLRWAWTRDERQEHSSRRKVLYFTVLYGSWFLIVVAAGVILEIAGYAGAAGSIWLFGVGFSVFVGVIDIVWESFKLATANRGESGVTLTLGSGNELSRSFRMEDDTWIGFIVTFAALIGVISALAVVTWLRG